MSDWGSKAIIDAFPRDGKSYFIQFITEPELKDRVDQQSGRKYQQLEANLQFFALNEFGEYSYIGWGKKNFQPCVFEDLLLYRDELMTCLFKVQGFEHKRHVDLEYKERLPRQKAAETLTRDAQAGGEPELVRKQIEAVESLTQGGPTPSFPLPAPQDTQPPATPCPHTGGIRHVKEQMVDANNLTVVLLAGFYCKDCGERLDD